MRTRGRTAALGIVAVLAGFMLLACDDDTETPTATPDASASATATDADTSPTPTEEAACRFEDAAELAVDASVLVIAGDSYGTAFHVGDGEFVTAEHVVAGLTSVTLESDRYTSEAEVVSIDVDADVALLRAAEGAGDLGMLTWFKDERVRPGQSAGTAGYPVDVTGTASVSRGTVSRVFEQDGHNVVQTDAPVNPGNSGGALFDECGSVIGVVVEKWEEAGVEGVAYATAFDSAQVALANGTPVIVDGGDGAEVGGTEGSAASFGDGTYTVGDDIPPGTYRNSDSSQYCYWERLSGFTPDPTLPGHIVEDVIESNVSYDIQTVTVLPDDAGFFALDCGTWTLVGGADSGEGAGEERSVFDLAPGDCFNFNTDESVIDTVEVVDCDIPHDVEAFYEFDLEDGDFPGIDQIDARWSDECTAQFPAFAGIAYEDSILWISAITPTEETWAFDDRAVLCYVEDLFGDPLTGSMRGRGE